MTAFFIFHFLTYSLLEWAKAHAGRHSQIGRDSRQDGNYCLNDEFQGLFFHSQQNAVSFLKKRHIVFMVL